MTFWAKGNCLHFFGWITQVHGQKKIEKICKEKQSHYKKIGIKSQIIIMFQIQKKKTKLHEYKETKGLMRITMINHIEKHGHTKFSK
jgi:hypothetical protein